MQNITLHGRLKITGSIKILSGLHIGGSTTNLEIGAVDLPVVRNAKTGYPYVPGSSLKGKMRSLCEKVTGAPQNQKIGGIYIHVAQTQQQYEEYWVNQIFGVPSNMDYEVSGPTRLTVRDVQLDIATLAEAANLDLPFTEVKWENTIDRVTAAAVPRQLERVPAGAVFTPMELVFNFYEEEDINRLPYVFMALQLVEDDYLGGQGSRGSGKVAFEDFTLQAKAGATYQDKGEMRFENLSELDESRLTEWITTQFFGN